VRSPVQEPALFDLPDLEVIQTSEPHSAFATFQIGGIGTGHQTTDVYLAFRRDRPGQPDQPYRIHVVLREDPTIADEWSVPVTPEQARHFAAQLVKAAAVAEEANAT